MAHAAAAGSGSKAWRALDRRPEMPKRAEGEALQRHGTDPIGNHERRERTKHAPMRPSTMAQRQQHELEFERAAVSGSSACAGNHADRFIGDADEPLAHRRMASRFPQCDEALALELAAEQGADAGACEAERMTGAFVDGEDEGIAEHVADRSRLDLAAFGGCAPATPPVPICEQLTARSMLHGAPVSPSRTIRVLLSLSGT